MLVFGTHEHTRILEMLRAETNTLPLQPPSTRAAVAIAVRWTYRCQSRPCVGLQCVSAWQLQANGLGRGSEEMLTIALIGVYTCEGFGK
jgi:hypothetical protein